MPVCLTCGSAEPEGKRFCGECGARLQTSSLEAGRERKVVTVLFCDLVAFTAASDGADPEEIQARLSPYHARCRDAIERFGGTVEKFIGDAVMAAFGAPTVHEDDPERAVRAGLALLDAVEELNVERGLGLSVRIGVATGEAVVSLSAQPSQGEGMLAGDVVNTAARLQSAAPVGRILVGQDTYVATRASIEYERHDPVVAKGKAEPIPVWVAVASRGSVGDDLSDTSRPMIGRDDELTQLQRSFTRASRESSVQLVTIVAEPGLGKSRLVQAFFAWIDAREELVIWRQGRCPPYGDAVAYAALADIVKAQTGILDSDPTEVATLKLDDTVRALLEGTDLAEQASWLSARLSPLVGVPASETSQEELFTAWRRFLEAMAATSPLILVVEDLHWADPALLEFLTHLVEWTVGVPLMVVATARPELYDKAPTWGAGHRNSSTLTLTPLHELETAQLITSLLGTRVLPAALHKALLKRAQGNPLYAREYLTILAEQPESTLDAVRVQELAEALPGSVQAVIAARLDTLPSESKHVLQAASVVGHTFWSGVVASLTDVDETTIRARLHDLVRRDYLRPSRTSRIAGEEEYTFAHALIADVAYGQLPRRDRARLHQLTAEWHAARIDTPDHSAEAALVAHHYTLTFEIEKVSGSEAATLAACAANAARWHTYAAEGTRWADVATALTHARKAFDLTPEPDSLRLSRLMLLGDLQWPSGQEAEAERTYYLAQHAAFASQDHIGVARAQVSRSEMLDHLGRVKEAEALREAAIAVLEQQPASASLVEAYIARAAAQIYAGRAREASETADRGVGICEQIPDVPPRILAKALEVRGYSRIFTGDPAAEADLSRALDIAVDQQLTADVAYIHDSLSTWHKISGSAESSLRHSQDAVETTAISGRQGSHLIATGNLAEGLVMSGRLDEAVAACARAAARDQSVATPVYWAALRGCWGWALLVRGNLAEAGALLSQTLSLASELDMDVLVPCLLAASEWEGAVVDSRTDYNADLARLVQDPATHETLGPFLSRLARALVVSGSLELLEELIRSTAGGLVLYDNNLLSAGALLAQARGEHADALALFEKAAVAWASYGYPLEQAHALIGAARCRTALGEPARAQLEEAHDILDRIGAAPLLAETEGLLAETPV